METSSIVNEGTPSRQRKLYTLVIPIEAEKKRIILGYKKRGFGVGKYNGYGGKVEPGETILEGAVRELEEESTLIAKEIDHIAILFLETVADPTQPILEIHVYSLTKWEGEPQETEEMRPGYYSYDEFSPSERTSQFESGQAESTTFSPPGSVSTVSHSSFPQHPPVPYQDMWEEAKLWMQEFLSALASSPTGLPPPLKFIHYVTFTGGHSKQLNKWDPWENLDKSYIAYFHKDNGEEDISVWTDGKKDAWLEKKKKEAVPEASPHPAQANSETISSANNTNSECINLTARVCPETIPAVIVEWAKKFQRWKAESERYIAQREAWNLEKQMWLREIEERAREKALYLTQRETYLRETEEWKDEEENWTKMMEISKEEKDRHVPGYIKWLDHRRGWVKKWERWNQKMGRWLVEWEKKTERRTRRIQDYENWVEECEQWMGKADAWIKEVKRWITENSKVREGQEVEAGEMDNLKDILEHDKNGDTEYETADERR